MQIACVSRLGLDRRVEVHRPFLVQQRLRHGVGERRAVGQRRAQARSRFGAQRHPARQSVEEAPACASSPHIVRPGVEQLGCAALADDARQQRAGAHVAAGEPDSHEQERGLAARRAEPQIARQREHGARARADAVDGSDDRLRARAHRLDQVAGHSREGEQPGIVASSCRGADDVVHVAAGAEIAAGAGDDDRLDVVAYDESAEEVAQLRVRVEGQRILALGPVERDRRHLAVRNPYPQRKCVRARSREAVASCMRSSLVKCRLRVAIRRGSVVARVNGIVAFSRPSSTYRRSRSRSVPSPPSSRRSSRSCAAAIASNARRALRRQAHRLRAAIAGRSARRSTSPRATSWSVIPVTLPPVTISRRDELAHPQTLADCARAAPSDRSVAAWSRSARAGARECAARSAACRSRRRSHNRSAS